jgi:hypothetical protein
MKYLNKNILTVIVIQKQTTVKHCKENSDYFSFKLQWKQNSYYYFADVISTVSMLGKLRNCLPAVGIGGQAIFELECLV